MRVSVKFFHTKAGESAGYRLTRLEFMINTDRQRTSRYSCTKCCTLFIPPSIKKTLCLILPGARHGWISQSHVITGALAFVPAGQTMTSIDSHCTRPLGLVNIWPARLPDFVSGDLPMPSIVHIALEVKGQVQCESMFAIVWPLGTNAKSETVT